MLFNLFHTSLVFTRFPPEPSYLCISCLTSLSNLPESTFAIVKSFPFTPCRRSLFPFDFAPLLRFEVRRLRAVSPLHMLPWSATVFKSVTTQGGLLRQQQQVNSFRVPIPCFIDHLSNLLKIQGILIVRRGTTCVCVLFHLICRTWWVRGESVNKLTVSTQLSFIFIYWLREHVSPIVFINMGQSEPAAIVLLKLNAEIFGAHGGTVGDGVRWDGMRKSDVRASFGQIRQAHGDVSPRNLTPTLIFSKFQIKITWSETFNLREKSIYSWNNLKMADRIEFRPVRGKKNAIGRENFVFSQQQICFSLWLRSRLKMFVLRNFYFLPYSSISITWRESLCRREKCWTRKH